MHTENFLRGRRRDELSQEELLVVEESIAEIRLLPARKTILKAGDKPDFSIFLIEGFICRYMDANDGKRQLVVLQIPGDFEVVLIVRGAGRGKIEPRLRARHNSIYSIRCCIDNPFANDDARLR